MTLKTYGFEMPRRRFIVNIATADKLDVYGVDNFMQALDLLTGKIVIQPTIVNTGMNLFIIRKVMTLNSEM